MCEQHDLIEVRQGLLFDRDRTTSPRLRHVGRLGVGGVAAVNRP
jgi:hypothetical protein